MRCLLQLAECCEVAKSVTPACQTVYHSKHSENNTCTCTHAHESALHNAFSKHVHMLEHKVQWEGNVRLAHLPIMTATSEVHIFYY